MHTYNLRCLSVSRKTLKFRYDSFFRKGVLPLGVPFCYLGETFLSEEVVKNFGFPTVGREEEKKILDVSTLESSGKVIHRLIGQVGAEYDSKDGDRCVWSDGHVVNSIARGGEIYKPFLTR